MKLVSYNSDKGYRSGLLINKQVYDLADSAQAIGLNLPESMLALLKLEEAGMQSAKQVQTAIEGGEGGVAVPSAELAAPVPDPTSCRDAYAFRQHVATARRNRGVPMIPEFDQFPIFYFTNHNAVYGGGDVVIEEDHLHKLDFELEAAIIVGKHGKNISASQADQYIAGYTIMNDFSARLLQMEEMKLNLGPAKGKDFATTIGPWLVTPDELESCRVPGKNGDRYNLRMQAFHNGKQISDGNMQDMNWTFAEILERVSYGTEIYPGDVIGSGTVGTGCYLELNGTAALEAKEQGVDFTPTWLEDRDVIELQIEGLGTLTNRIVHSGENYSILAKKKKTE
ncbi:MAG: fumarylacetoacetate hydrolase family protein [Candidatus Marinimicrobia bacterium]|nr:fumarylacetoacetate hydrolase family protein [Candidatus Neomarinimicrobiota bacterium]MCF7904179.1 fumarylacetoacetate hydrolase family protein [Candidatus Neomarinimicrobiota bacterium]